MEQYRKTSKCYVCGKNTNGCFNKATEIIERLKIKHANDSVCYRIVILMNSKMMMMIRIVMNSLVVILLFVCNDVFYS